MLRHLRPTLVLAALLAVAGCAGQGFDPAEPLEPLGDFRLGYNIVVADAPQQGPFSRDVSDEEWEQALTQAIDARLGRYDGTGLYHIGVKVEAYVAAAPGVPVIYSPRSILLLAVNVWDNRTQERLTAEAQRLTVYESTTGGSAVFGSGHSRTKEEQIAGLTENAAKELQDFLAENIEWFQREPAPGEPVTFPPAPDSDGAPPVAVPPAN